LETPDTENVSVFADCNIMDTVDEIDIMSQVLIMINYEKKTDTTRQRKIFLHSWNTTII
jgi:hypothetical protein